MACVRLYVKKKQACLLTQTVGRLLLLLLSRAIVARRRSVTMSWPDVFVDHLALCLLLHHLYSRTEMTTEARYTLWFVS